jgi:DNA-binding response OmpR family regulator
VGSFEVLMNPTQAADPAAVNFAPVPVLVAHNDDGVRARIRRTLVDHELLVEDVSNWAGVLGAARHDNPFVLVVGAQLAGIADLVDLVRAYPGVRGVLVIVGERDERVGARALDAGLDDFVREPTLDQDLAARVQVLVRRAGPRGRPTLEFGDLVINPAEREVRLQGRPVALTAREFDLLAFLASAPRVTFTREELLERVWRSSPDWQGVATVTEHVRRIREKLQQDGEQPWLHTVRGSGYLFRP